MTYAIVFSSATGNTRKVAEAIRGVLPAQDCLYFGGPDPAALNAELLFLGSWADKGTCTDEMAAFIKTLPAKKVALFGTAGFGGAPAYFAMILDRVAALLPAACTVEGRFMCQGHMQSGVRARYEKMLAGSPGDPKLQGFLDNFDKAATHPDETDLKNAADFAARLIG